MSETPEQFVARLGLEPPPDPEHARQWWDDVRFTMGELWWPTPTTQDAQQLIRRLAERSIS